MRNNTVPTIRARTLIAFYYLLFVIRILSDRESSFHENAIDCHSSVPLPVPQGQESHHHRRRITHMRPWTPPSARRRLPPEVVEARMRVMCAEKPFTEPGDPPSGALSTKA